MPPVFQRNNNSTNAIKRSGFIQGMQRTPVYDSPDEENENMRRLSSVENREEDSGSCSSSSIGRNSDVSGESSSDDEDLTDTEAQSELKGPSDTMDALEEVLPMRRGISKFYNGKSKSFTSLADAVAASSIEEFAKPDNPYSKNRKDLLIHGSFLEKNRNHSLRNIGTEIWKKLSNSGRSIVTSGTTKGSPDSKLVPSSSTCLPPLHPQYKSSTITRSSLPTPRLNPPCRSFSLSDLQFVAATTSNIGGLTVRSGDSDNKLHRI